MTVCKRLIIVLLVAMGMHVCVSAYVVLSAQAETTRHLEYLGRRLGMEEIAQERENPDHRFTLAMHARVDDTVADARWWAYRLLLKEGIRLRDSSPDAVVAVFIPTRALPWWCLFRSAEQCLVLRADLSVHEVATAGVPWKL